MKREYFGMLFMLGFVLLIFLAEFLFGEIIWEYMNTFIVIWILIAYLAGQYSMRFPKAF